MRASGVHGRGLFARRGFARGETIVEYVGRRISKGEGDRIALREEARGRIFVFDLGRAGDLDGDVSGNVARFANHSCDGNAEAVIRKGRVFLVARRRIREGDEITYDYEFEWDDDPWPCECGAARCREFIVAEGSVPSGREGGAASGGSKPSSRRAA
ncbi:MAG: SET domain-containing protein [Methanobacteriota archaeon]